MRDNLIIICKKFIFLARRSNNIVICYKFCSLQSSFTDLDRLENFEGRSLWCKRCCVSDKSGADSETSSDDLRCPNWKNSKSLEKLEKAVLVENVRESQILEGDWIFFSKPLMKDLISPNNSWKVRTYLFAFSVTYLQKSSLLAYQGSKSRQMRPSLVRR